MGPREILQALQQGKLDLEAAEAALGALAAEDLNFACIDHEREERCGFPEVIYGAGKTPEQLALIAERILARSSQLLATRVSAEGAEALLAAVPGAEYHEQARCVCFGRPSASEGVGLVAVVAAGTSDLPVAEEARLSSEMLGARVETHFDIGVAGLHRLLGRSERLQAARAIVVVAGMEGALPSVVGGLVRRPVIAVPSSVGYGASFGGLAALLGMLNSCASGVSVVNIDNGFGAGYQAALINRAAEPA
ncbi:MAG: 1-(5-phosphoribosyl)-5-amino-4-imidazole-carboxylate carboxylase [Planctomycetota bacterium]|nr:MAG: 1-(5-phosphoribosyl)-5-amino-4-imidazole-carboxylate carboxylase [Planctomycetota bacterium]